MSMPETPRPPIPSGNAPAAPAAQQGQGNAIKVGQMLRLMGVEVDNARAHGYPLTCLMIEFDQMEGELARESRRVLLPELFQCLKKACIETGVRGLGVTKDPYVLAVFPHTPPAKARDLADHIVTKARSLGAPGGVSARCSVSIGISHNQHAAMDSFVALIEEAEVGLALAKERGGGQASQWREVEAEVEQLREDLVSGLQIAQSGPSAEEEARDELEWSRALLARMSNLFQDEPERSEGVLRLQKQALQILSDELGTWAETFASRLVERSRQVGRLEKRLAKLSKSLDSAEAELKRVASMKTVDTGLSSIYRNVQGLSGQDERFEEKSGMLKNIFEANLELQK